MAPVTGRFDADFASFYTAVRQAQAELKGFESSNADVEKSLNRMVDSFSGRRVISEATLMAEAVRRIGGPARLSAADLQRAGAVANEAAEKFKRWGQAVPSSILDIQKAASGAGNSLSSTARSIREVDNVLDLFGVHLGPARKAIDDLGFASEQGADKLGFIGTAGLAVGAGIAGWQIGRAVSDFFKLDEVIGNATARLLGFGDVAAETAAVKADALAKASKEIGFQVTNYSTALAVNEAAAKAATEANKKMDDQLARQKAPEIMAARYAKLKEEIESLRKEGVLDDLTRDINSHAFSMEELSKAYRISTEALQVFGKEAQNVGRIEANNAKQLEKLAEEIRQRKLKKLEEEAAAEKKRLEDLYSQIDASTKANEGRKAMADAELDAQIAARRATEAETRALEEQRWAAENAARAIGGTNEYDLSTEAGRKRFLQLNPGGQIKAPSEYFETHTLAEAVEAGLVAFYGGSGTDTSSPQARARPTGSEAPGEPRQQQSTSGFGAGAQGFGGGGAEAPAGIGRGRGIGGVLVHAPVYVSGVFDPSSAHALSRTVGDGMYRTLLQSRKVKAA